MLAVQSRAGRVPFRDIRLRRHADYGLVYSASRMHRSETLAYFYRERPGGAAARFGITTPRVLGPATVRNRIKRRLRVVCRAALPLLPAGVDVVLHPKVELAELPFHRLEAEIAFLFRHVAQRIASGADNTPLPRGPRNRK